MKELIILVAEDDEISYTYLHEILLDENIQVLRAHNGIDAVNICKEKSNIDLILMDIKMPLLNGLEATKQIKKIHPTIPIIAQSAYVSSYDKEIAKNYGCDDYIEKPIKMEKLYDLIEKHTACKLNI